MTWKAESYQLVAFHSPHENEDAFQVWLQLFQSSPDNFQRHPDISVNATMANGKAYGLNWQVHCAPGRVDLFVSQNEGDNPFPEIKDEFGLREIYKRKILSPLFTKVRALRLAVVCNYFHDFSSLVDAAKNFSRITNISIDAERSLDVNFGLNVRKDVKELAVTLNRLCRWQTLEKQAMKVQINVPIQDFVPQIVQPALMFSVDINTVAQQSAFDVITAESICAYMLDEVTALKEGGYDRLIRA